MAEKPKMNTKIFRRLVSYTKPYRLVFTIALLTTILLAFIGPARPFLIKIMIDRYVMQSPDGHMLFMWSLLLIGLLLLEGVFQFISAYYSNLLAQDIIKDIRQKLFAHILSFRMRYFDKTSIGSLVTRVVSDLEAISEVFSAGLFAMMGDMLMLLAILAGMFIVNWKLALMCLISVPILLVATRIFARAMQKSFQLERLQVNKLNTFVQERLVGMNIVQLFNRQEQEYEQFREINKGHRQAHINAVWANSIFFPVVELLSSLSVALLLVYVLVRVEGRSDQDIRLMFGEIMGFTLWIYMLFRPIRQMADKFNILQRGTVRAERVFETLDVSDHIQDEGAVTTCDFKRDIEFKNVYFAYNNEEWVLKNINLRIEAGKTVAFVGATGAGKSSIVNLIGRFYEYQQGSICIGDTDIRDLQLAYLRSNIAIVLQDVFLFSDTILNNITLNDPEISREQVIEAAKAVGAHEFIMRLPGDYDYHVGERGGVLSVGQRQLLSFIRAYVYDPKILILDEATSSIDTESEELIQKATDKLTVGRTSIVIAHRLSTIQKADKIVVMESGEIMETGTHQELLALEDGYYRRLFEMQFSEQNERNE